LLFYGATIAKVDPRPEVASGDASAAGAPTRGPLGFGAVSAPVEGPGLPLGEPPDFWHDRADRSTPGEQRMTIRSPLRFGRRTFMGGGLAWALSAVAAQAQLGGTDRPPSARGGGGGTTESSSLDADKLEALIQKALAEPDETPLSRPAILGLGSTKLTTKSIERSDADSKYGFMVIIPRRDNGLIFFRGSDKPLFFAMHRTGEGLKRHTSAINRDGKLEKWSGADAEADFARQLAFWAK
jgi:hypothetical protein